jgi:glycosyltransferase involved in cell wall biosynthesis
VTALVAAHDAAPFIRTTLGSLLHQAVDDLEILAVDDGSTDGTADRVREAAGGDGRIRLLALGRNRGQAAALNVGLLESRGRYLALLDADDEATPERLALQIAALEARPGLVLVGGAAVPWCDRHGEEGPAWRYATDDAAIRARSLFKSEFISGAMTLDLEVMRRHGVRFDETLRLGVDWALSLRMQELGPVANLPGAVLRYRIHPGQMTARMPDHVGSDSARIRLSALAALGLRPSDVELRTHLAVSPCAYWPFGTHPYFAERRATLRDDARRWFARLLAAARSTRRVPPRALRAFLDEIEALLEEALAGRPEAGGARPGAPSRTCLGDGYPRCSWEPG